MVVDHDLNLLLRAGPWVHQMVEEMVVEAVPGSCCDHLAFALGEEEHQVVDPSLVGVLRAYDQMVEEEMHQEVEEACAYQEVLAEAVQSLAYRGVQTLVACHREEWEVVASLVVLPYVEEA